MWCCLLSGSIFPLFDEAYVSCLSSFYGFFVFDKWLAQGMAIIVSESWKEFEQVIWVAAKDTDIENRHLTKYPGIFTALHPTFCQSPAALPWGKKMVS